MKIAFDQNVPIAMVRVLQTFANEKQFRKISGKFEIKAAAEYVPRKGDPDYQPKNDAPWLKRFAQDGGRVVISGDAMMKSRPHERLALVEGGFIVIFFERQWSNWKFWRKCALLVYWWPVIAEKIKRTRKASFYHVPCNWVEDGKLRWVSNQDPKLIKSKRKAREKLGRKQSLPTSHPEGPLFEYARRVRKSEPR